MKNTRQTRREAKQLFRLCLVNGLLDDGRVRQVVQSVLESKRRRSPALLARFLYLVRLDRDRHRAEVESATPIEADLRDGIQAGLARKYGPGISTSFAVNQALIGGMRVRVGSDVYDGSLRASLSALEKDF